MVIEHNKKNQKGMIYILKIKDNDSQEIRHQITQKEGDRK